MIMSTKYQNTVECKNPANEILEMRLSISNALFLPKFMINVTILLLKLSISQF